MSNQKIVSIHYLRAVACLMVVGFHAVGGATGHFFVGQAGVDLFFVISGFIMWTITENRETAPITFLKKRFWRVVPLYWLITTAIFLYRLPSERYSLVDFFSSMLFLHHVNRDGSIEPILLQGWTLNFEIQFYAIVFIALFLRRKLQWAGIAAAIFSLVAIGWLVPHTSVIASLYTDPILLEFLVGIAVAKARLSRRMAAWPMGGVMIAVGLAVLLAEQLSIASFVAPRVIVFGVPSALILFGMVSSERMLAPSLAFDLLGDCSYEIYLIHGSVINVLSHLLAPGMIFAVGSFAASIFAGYLIHVGQSVINRMRNSSR